MIYQYLHLKTVLWRFQLFDLGIVDSMVAVRVDLSGGAIFGCGLMGCGDVGLGIVDRKLREYCQSGIRGRL